MYDVDPVLLAEPFWLVDTDGVVVTICDAAIVTNGDKVIVTGFEVTTGEVDPVYDVDPVLLAEPIWLLVIDVVLV